MRKWGWMGGGLLILGLLLLGCRGPAAVGVITPEAIPVRSDLLRLLWITGYPLDDPRTAQLQVGLREYLAAQGYGAPYGNLQLETYYLETAPSLAVAVAEVQTFAPHIAVISGEEAARTFIPAYPDRTLPFVFCALHGNPVTYGLDLSHVTGVLARPRLTETLRVAHVFLPDAQRFMVLTAESTESAALVGPLAQQGAAVDFLIAAPLMRVVGSWEAWQQVVLQESAAVDFLILVDYYTLRDATGALVRPREVVRWTTAHSAVPVFGLWQQTVIDGAVGGLVLSASQQGATAASQVVRIAGGVAPAAIPPAPPVQNLLSVNLAAARRWQLQIPLELVLAAQIEALSQPQGGP